MTRISPKEDASKRRSSTHLSRPSFSHLFIVFVLVVGVVSVVLHYLGATSVTGQPVALVRVRVQSNLPANTPSPGNLPSSLNIPSCSPWRESSCDGRDNNDNGCIDEGCPERCDNQDNNANRDIDEGCDDDNDNYCQSNIPLAGTPSICPLGGGDCNDNNALTHPGVTETCNAFDDNCDGTVDEGCDDDNDDYCDISIALTGIAGTCRSGGQDCADNNRARNPGMTEICNNVDDNCDNRVDEGNVCCTPRTETCNSRDDDCDGSVDEGNVCCTPSREVCDGEDNDCDSQVDEGAACTPTCTDSDGDNPSNRGYVVHSEDGYPATTSHDSCYGTDVAEGICVGSRFETRMHACASPGFPGTCSSGICTV